MTEYEVPPAAHRLSFGVAADDYDQYRPHYPPAALAWALSGVMSGERPRAAAPDGHATSAGHGPADGAPGERRRVADLGAGTGILTRDLLALGHEVVPVEPDPGMRDRLARSTPGTHALAGGAEEIPLPDASVDAVLAGQAYHWFDRARAHAEIARIVRDGGVFAPLWNVRDDSVPWVARLTEIIDDAQAPEIDTLLPSDLGPGFGPVDRAEFRHEVTMTAERLVSLIRTRSYYLVAPAERRSELEAQVAELAAELPAEFALPYLTIVLRANRRPR